MLTSVFYIYEHIYSQKHEFQKILEKKNYANALDSWTIFTFLLEKC